MKKMYLIPTLAAVLLASCASVPTELYESVTAQRMRATRFAPVQTYAPQEFAEGETNYNEAAQLISTKKELKRTPELLTAAQTAYGIVIETGMPAYATDLQKEINSLLEQALAVKANAGLKSRYDAVTADFDDAKETVGAGDYDNALEKFESVKKDAEDLLAAVKAQFESSLAEVDAVKQKQERLEEIVKSIEQLDKSAGE